MYIPAYFEESRLDVLHSLIEKQTLGTFVVTIETVLISYIIPVLIDSTRGRFGVLQEPDASENSALKTHYARIL